MVFTTFFFKVVSHPQSEVRKSREMLQDGADQFEIRILEGKNREIGIFPLCILAEANRFFLSSSVFSVLARDNDLSP